MKRSEFLKISITGLATLAALPYVVFAKPKPPEYQLIGYAHPEGQGIAGAFAEAKAKALLRHSTDLERLYLFGGIYERRDTRGIFRYEGKSRLRNLETGEIVKA